MDLLSQTTRDAFENDDLIVVRFPHRIVTLNLADSKSFFRETTADMRSALSVNDLATACQTFLLAGVRLQCCLADTQRAHVQATVFDTGFVQALLDLVKRVELPQHISTVLKAFDVFQILLERFEPLTAMTPLDELLPVVGCAMEAHSFALLSRTFRFAAAMLNLHYTFKRPKEAAACWVNMLRNVLVHPQLPDVADEGLNFISAFVKSEFRLVADFSDEELHKLRNFAVRGLAISGVAGCGGQHSTVAYKRIFAIFFFCLERCSNPCEVLDELISSQVVATAWAKQKKMSDPRHYIWFLLFRFRQQSMNTPRETRVSLARAFIAMLVRHPLMNNPACLATLSKAISRVGRQDATFQMLFGAPLFVGSMIKLLQLQKDLKSTVRPRLLGCVRASLKVADAEQLTKLTLNHGLVSVLLSGLQPQKEDKKEPDGGFSLETLRCLRKLTARVQELDLVRSGVSLADLIRSDRNRGAFVGLRDSPVGKIRREFMTAFNSVFKNVSDAHDLITLK